MILLYFFLYKSFFSSLYPFLSGRGERERERERKREKERERKRKRKKEREREREQQQGFGLRITLDSAGPQVRCMEEHSHRNS